MRDDHYPRINPLSAASEARWREISRYEAIYRDRPDYQMCPRVRIALRGWLRDQAAHQSFLDVGCGRGESLELASFAQMLPVQGVEVVSSLAERADVELISGAHELPFGTGSFDLVTCLDVLEHIPPGDTEAALGEIFRVAKVGVLIMVAWHPSSFRDDQGELHINQRSASEWEDLICRAMGAGLHPVTTVTGKAATFEIRPGDTLQLP